MTKWNLEKTDMDKAKQDEILKKATKKAIDVILQGIINAECTDFPSISASIDFEGRIYTLEFKIEEKQE
jgi:hypothetical protein